MTKRIYVGNLPFTTNDEGLRELFSEYGNVEKTQVITDRETGRSRGFGFVEMSSGGDEAIDTLNGHSIEGRNLTVNEARPRK